MGHPPHPREEHGERGSAVARHAGHQRPPVVHEQEESNDTVIIVHSIFAAKMKNIKLQYHKYYMTMAAQLRDNDHIYIINSHALATWTAATNYNDMLEDTKRNVEKERERVGNPFSLLMGDMNTEWSQELWQEDREDGEYCLPRERRPRHSTKRHAALMVAVRDLRLEPPR